MDFDTARLDALSSPFRTIFRFATVSRTIPRFRSARSVRCNATTTKRPKFYNGNHRTVRVVRNSNARTHLRSNLEIGIIRGALRALSAVCAVCAVYDQASSCSR